MLKKKDISDSIIQLYALIEKDLKLRLRYKTEFFIEYFTPLIMIFFPLIIFSTLFNIEENIFGGYFSSKNYILFILLAYCIECLLVLLWSYKSMFNDEKVWQTVKGLLIAPTSKYHILLGHLIAGLIAKSLPIIIIFIICLFFFPISFFYFLLVVIVFLSLSIVIASIGFIIGLFKLVNENVSATLTISISMISFFSCLFYPIEIFPEFLQFIVKLNPLYYFFDLLRLVWWAGIDLQMALHYITINHIIIVVAFSILMPLATSYLFFKIYYKYGIGGY